MACTSGVPEHVCAGNIVCITMTGKLMSVGYGIVGIPLMLCVLAQIGACIEYLLRKLCNAVARWAHAHALAHPLIQCVQPIARVFHK
jgi:hypothetical protein